MEKVENHWFEYLLPESYLAYVKNSVGTGMFRNFYVMEKGKRRDVLNDGKMSCAVFVSTVLRNFGLIEKLHFTVGKTVEDMERCGWSVVPAAKAKPGDVLVWSSQKGQTGMHNHIGFYVGGRRAVSNSEKKKVVVRHGMTFGGKRSIELVMRPNWKKAYAKS